MSTATDGSTLPIPKAATGHDPEPLPSTADPHDLPQYDEPLYYPAAFLSIIQSGVSEASSQKFSAYFFRFPYSPHTQPFAAFWISCSNLFQHVSFSLGPCNILNFSLPKNPS
jgi:TolA-binding protein